MLRTSPKKSGVALIGLGEFAYDQLVTVFQQARYARLAAVVTDEPDKAEAWQREFGFPDSGRYDYDTFDRVADNPDVDLVYVVVPNALHRGYVERAARAGKHVLCEKPIATTVRDAEAMIAACRKADVQLAMSYRLRFEPHHQELVRLARERRYGKIKLIESGYGFGVRDDQTSRLDPALSGGGPLLDAGIYAVHAARWLAGEEPVSVTAQAIKTNPEKFAEVEETLTWQLRFPSGILATSSTSFAFEVQRLTVWAEYGHFELTQPFGYGPFRGRTPEGPIRKRDVNSQLRLVDETARCLLRGEPVPVPGPEGLNDLRIIDAIYEAARTKREVRL
jgi:predicted dehydrogenase